MTTTITLTVREIADLATFAGLEVGDPSEFEMLQELTITTCPHAGLLDEDDGSVSHYHWVAYMTEYPEEGATGLGEVLKP